MKMNRKPAYAIAVVMFVGAAAGGAFAKGKNEDANDMAALSSMKVSLTQAIATAEQQGGGKAVSADIVTKGGSPRIAVELVASGSTKKITIDGQTGQVTGNAAGDTDSDDD
jgi:uncharacterized membrane protein YkoI